MVLGVSYRRLPATGGKFFRSYKQKKHKTLNSDAAQMNTIPPLVPSQVARLHHAYKNLKCENIPNDDSMCETLHPLGDLNLGDSLLCDMSFKKDGKTFCEHMQACAQEFEKLSDFETCAIDFQKKFVSKTCPEGMEKCETYCTLNAGGFGCSKAST